MRHANHKTKSLLRWTLRAGLAASLLIHAGLLIVMLFGSVRGWLDQQPIRVIQASSSYTRRGEQDRETMATIVIDEDAQAPTNLQEQIKESLAATEQLSEAERIEALDKAAGRLARISSESSVDDVARKLQSWLGLTPRAQQPVVVDPTTQDVDSDAAEEEFDFTTAQLHDVIRILVPDSRPQYLCVLLDARGRTMEVPLSEAEGAPIYSLMQKIKAHPLLERIYRQVAMPLLDQMVQAQRAAAAAASEANLETATGATAGRELPDLVPSTDDEGP